MSGFSEENIRVLREKYRITEYKDGCVWKTETIGLVWISLAQENNPPKDTGYCSLGHKQYDSVNGHTIHMAGCKLNYPAAHAFKEDK